jgi:hypothetical protein
MHAAFRYCIRCAVLVSYCNQSHRLRSMSCKALVTRVRRITNVGKLHSFIKVSRCAGRSTDVGIVECCKEHWLCVPCVGWHVAHTCCQ